MRKVFIVARNRPDLYASLWRVLEVEGDVLIIYDRRSRDERRRGRAGWWPFSSPSELSWPTRDRRRRTDVDDEIRDRGFGVVHLVDDEGAYGDDDDIDQYDWEDQGGDEESLRG